MVLTCLIVGIVIPTVQKPVGMIQQYRWNNVTIVGGGFVTGILFHPKQRNLAYARTDIGGAYRWDSHARRWIPLLDWLQWPDWNLYGVESIGLDSSDPKKLYLACGTYMGEFAGNGAILRSDDQGRTFKRTDMPFRMGGNQNGRSIGERLAVDPNDGKVQYMGSRNAGLWRSEDGAVTWNQVNSFPIVGPTNGIGVGVVVFDPWNGQKGQPTKDIYIGVASTREGLYHSSDAGVTWAPVPGQPTGMYPQHIAIDPAGDLYLTYANGPGPNGLTNGAVWKLNLNTGTWTDITPIKPGNPGGFGYAGLSLDVKHPGTLAVTTLDRWNPGDDLFRSTDGGIHWTAYKSGAIMDPSASPYLKWGEAKPKFGWWMGTLGIDPFDSNHILFGTGATIWGTNDALDADLHRPTHWTVRAQGIEECAAIGLVSPPVGAHLFSCLGDVGGFRHDDFKVSPPEGMYENPLFSNTDDMDFAELKPQLMARVGRANTGVRRGAYSEDGGKTWLPFPSEPAGSRGGGHVAVTCDGSAIVWAPIGDVPNVTRDEGRTWTPCVGAPQTGISQPIAPTLQFFTDLTVAPEPYTKAMTLVSRIKFSPMDIRSVQAFCGRFQVARATFGFLWMGPCSIRMGPPGRCLGPTACLMSVLSVLANPPRVNPIRRYM